MQRLDHFVMKLTRLIAQIAAADEDGLIIVWDLMTAPRIRTIDTEDHELRCLGFRRDEGTLAAAGKSRTIRLWDPITGQELLRLEDHKGQINSVEFSRHGRTLASRSHDGVVRLRRAEPADRLARP